MAVPVIVVGRAVGEDNGEKCQKSCKEVEAGVCSFGKNTEAVGQQADGELEPGQENRRKHRCQGNDFFFL